MRTVGMQKGKALYEMTKASVGCKGGISIETLVECYEAKNRQ
ncbi:transposase [Thermoanaerobacterium thermosaccharolyticum]|uniref:Transposase n=1 Tax=Thermoanaerobacterium thermosaccharolyticum TaxID=1517 RepID=A0A223I0N3_THETR|nr:transposase [Thermoanaerobacterium thermosaccharolyticum]